MHRYGRALDKKTLGSVLAVALVAGVAFAAESQTVAVPAGNAFTATAVLLPGGGGGDVLGVGGRGENDVDLDIGFGSDGLLRVNGDVVGPYGPNATYTVTVVGRLVAGGWVADTTVVNEDTGATEYVQIGHPMGGKPATVSATALDVIDLACE